MHFELSKYLGLPQTHVVFKLIAVDWTDGLPYGTVFYGATEWTIAYTWKIELQSVPTDISTAHNSAELSVIMAWIVLTQIWHQDGCHAIVLEHMCARLCWI